MRKLLLAFAALGVLVLPCESASARNRRAPPTVTQNEGGQDVGYFSNYLTGPGGMRIPVRDYPGSATVITRKMMDDVQARSVCDALRLAPGVSVGNCW